MEKEASDRNVCKKAIISPYMSGKWDWPRGWSNASVWQDTQPFRERSRRIAPADIDDVHRHLKDLLEAGIIKQSRLLLSLLLGRRMAKSVSV